MMALRTIKIIKSKTTSIQRIDRTEWYQSSHQFWNNSSPDQNGVMMGRADLNQIDISASKSFLEHLSSRKQHFSRGNVLDCGAGIGRVSTHLLKHHFQEVDMVQKSQNLLNEAKVRCSQKVYRQFYCSGLQSFVFSHKYDTIWVQWVLTHLKNKEILDFLARAKESLREGGLIVVKENFSTNKEIVDEQDCTIIRTNHGWKSLFYESNTKIFYQQEQPDWPKELYPVKMWALI